MSVDYGRIAADDKRHGTYNAYQNFGCRCESCRQANTDYHRLARRRRGVRSREQYAEDVKRHGISAYLRRGCRCEVCRAASAAAKRRYRARQRAARARA